MLYKIKGILQLEIAYGIISIGKRKIVSNGDAQKNENPRVAARGFSCLIILDGRPDHQARYRS